LEIKRRKRAEAYYLIGRFLHNAGEMDKAKEYYERALKEMEEFPEGWIDLGRWHAEQHNYREALRCFKKAIIGHDHHIAWLELGKVLEQLGRFEEALHAYKRCMAQSPSTLGLKEYLNLCIELGMAEEILNITRKHIYKEEMKEFVFRARGYAYELIGLWDEAEYMYRKCLEINPKNVEALVGMANTFHNRGKHVEALKWVLRALKETHEHWRAWFIKGKIHDAMGSYESAIECFDRAYELNKDNMEILLEKANTYYSMRKYVAGIKCCSKVLKKEILNEEAWYRKGLGFLWLRRYKEAWDCFNAALKINPNMEKARIEKEFCEKEMENMDS